MAGNHTDKNGNNKNSVAKTSPIISSSADVFCSPILLTSSSSVSGHNNYFCADKKRLWTSCVQSEGGSGAKMPQKLQKEEERVQNENDNAGDEEEDEEDESGIVNVSNIDEEEEEEEGAVVMCDTFILQ